jgi:hypothetical protein
VADLSPNALDGTAVGSPAWVPGIRGPFALSFLNGTSQYVNVPDAAELDVTGAITLAAWIRPTQVATASILNKATFNSGPVFGYELNLSITGVPFVRLFNDTQAAGGGRLNATVPYPTDGSTWMHVAATYDGAEIRMYINGALDVTRASASPIPANSLPFVIGATSDGAASRVFPGAIDDARLYARALTAGEIATLASLTPATHTITASAGPGGSIAPEGAVEVEEGEDQEFLITADPGYHIADVLVDGESAGPVASHTFLDVMAAHTISASFAPDPPPPTSTVDVGAPAGPITGAEPSRTVPVTISRTDLTPLLGFSVTIAVSPPLEVEGGMAGIEEGTYLVSANPSTTFQVVDDGVDLDGNHVYVVDGATLGLPCGSAAASGTLFTVRLTSAAAGGSGTVSITSLTLRDCGNADLPRVIGTAATVVVDQSPPVVQVTAPNGGETWLIGTTHNITWTGSDAEGIASYDLAYSTDGGATWPHAIATVAGTSTSYPWTIPAAAGTTNRVRVTAVDANGNGGDDASDADFTIAPIPANGALAFDGTAQHVTFGAAPELRASHFTVELWFRRTGAGTTASTGSGGVVAVPLLAKGRSEADGDGRDVNYFLGIDGAGRLVADYEEGMGQASPGLNHPVVGTTVIANDVWYHGAAVFDGSSLRLYLNGELDGVVTGLAGRNPEALSTQHTTLATTRNSTGALQGFFAGEIDEPRIWAVPRSQCEVIAAMNSPLPSGTGLAGRWGLDEGTGPTAANSVAGSPDGTLVNDPTWIPGAPFDLTPPVVPVPEAPSGLLAAAPDAHQVQLSWTDHASSESGTEIERSTSGEAGPFVPLATVGPDVTSYVDAVLDAQTEYCYRVRAVGCAGNSDYTAAACATTTELLCRALALTPGGAGTNAYVRLGNPSALRLPQFTLELWVRRDGSGIATASASTGITDGIPLITRGRSQNDTPANNVNYFLCIRQSDGVLAADFEEGSAGPTPGASHPVAGATPLSMGVWHHAAATYDGATWRLYLDGNLDAELAVNRPPASESTAEVALAGALNTLGVPAGYLEGAIDEVRIWNVARTEAEIQGSMMLALVAPTPGLVGRWGLDEGAGPAVYGTAGTGLHGTIVGSEVTDWSRVDCVFSTVGAEPGAVSELELGPVVPNPMRERTSFQFALPEAGPVRLEILDVRGRRLAVLVDGEQEAGRHSVRWDGRTERGGVAAGVYFLRFTSLGRELTRRFVLLPR